MRHIPIPPVARTEAAGFAAGLSAAELALRRHGLTGAQAFDALVAGLLNRLGEPNDAPLAAREAVAALPLGRDLDVLGLAYERFFPDLFKGLHGQYFTPPAVARLLLARLEVRRGERVLDPACGAGGLLVAAHRAGAAVVGVELDPRLAQLARVVLRASGASGAVMQGDMFAADLPEADVVIANPPFSIPVTDPEVLDRWGYERPMSSDALFIDVVRSVLRPGGRAGVVMPSSLLANPRWRELRDRIDGSFVRRAVCALPEGVFRPFGGAGGRAALLWLERRGPSPDAAPPCQWASLADPGYDPRSIALKPTSMEEVDRLAAGVGWEPLAVGRWTPRRPHLAGVTIGSLCRLRAERAPSGADGWRVDLADVDRVRGECHPVKDRPTSARQRVVAGDVLVARLRPELGNVAVAYGERLLGSPEWLVLADCPAPHLLATLLRTEAWRTHLPTTGGQTRPRTTADAVLGSRVPWPADEQRDALEAGIAGLYAARADIAERLARIEAAAAEYVETGDVEAFAAVVHGAAVEGVGRPG